MNLKEHIKVSSIKLLQCNNTHRIPLILTRMSWFLTRRYSSIFRCCSNVGFRGKLFQGASFSTQLPDSHSWDSIYTRLRERERSIREPFYAIGRMPIDSFIPLDALTSPVIYDKPFWRARLFHPDMVKTGLVSGGYTKAEADIFYRKKYVEGAVGVARKHDRSVSTQPGTFQKVYNGDEDEEAYYDFHFFPGKKYGSKVDYAHRRQRAKPGNPDLREKIPHSQVMAGELFFDFDMYTNTASMQHVRAFIFCSWPMPLKKVDIKITRSDGRSSTSWDHWASDVLFDKDTKRIEFMLTDLNKRVTHVPCFILSELPRKPLGLAIKDKLIVFVKSVGVWVAFFAGLCGTYVAIDLIVDIFLS